MSVSYNRLWKLLIDFDNISKTELARRCGISPRTISRMNKELHVSTDVLERICIFLDCNIEDVVEIKRDKKNGSTY